jgi:hypothetical protein
VTNEQPRRYHYAIAVQRVRRGYKVVARTEHRSRAEADKGSLRLLAHHHDTAAITLERELVNGEVLDVAALKR